MTKKTLYQKMLTKEQAVGKVGTRGSLATHNSNSKVAGTSVGFPAFTCNPTRLCASNCYAWQGFQAFPRAIKKRLEVYESCVRYPKSTAAKLILQAASEDRKKLRLADAGDIDESLFPFVDFLLHWAQKFKVELWGFTKRPQTWLRYPWLMFSIDRTTPSKIREFVENHVPSWKRAWLNDDDSVPWTKVGVVFREHGSISNPKNRKKLDKVSCMDEAGTGDCQETCFKCNGSFFVPSIQNENVLNKGD